MFGKLFWSHLVVILTRVETGFAEMQFKRAEKDKDIKHHIHEEFKLDQDEYDIPVIPVGLDNYEKAIEQLVESFAVNKFGVRKSNHHYRN